MANFDAPYDFSGDAEARGRLQIVNKIAAYNKELGMSSVIAGSEHEARLISFRDALVFREARAVAFLIHYNSL